MVRKRKKKKNQFPAMEFESKKKVVEHINSNLDKLNERRKAINLIDQLRD